MGSSRLSREALLLAIKPVNRHVPTLAEIGASVGLTRERVRQRLVAEGITKDYSSAMPLCGNCKGKLRSAPARQRGYCHRCSPMPLYVRCVCGQCGCVFFLTLTEYRGRLRAVVGNRTTPRTTPLFCSKPCHGRWFGLRHGWGTQRRKREGG